MSVLRYFYFASYFLFLISLLIGVIAISLMPLIGDDLSNKFNVLSSNNSIIEYFKFNFYNHTGRLTQIILLFLFFNYNPILIISKILILPLFFILTYLMWFVASNKFIKFNDKDFWKYLIFSLLLWLTLPSISQTVVWTSGSTTYFYPSLISLIYLTLFKFYVNISSSTNFYYKIFILFLIFITGFISGSSQIQIGLSILVILIFWIFNAYTKLNKSDFFALLITSLGFFLGLILLLLAPGNYERISNENELNNLSRIVIFLFYVLSAPFKLGVEDKGANLFLSIILLLILFRSGTDHVKNNIIKSAPFLFSALASLFIFIFVPFSVSPRTLFFFNIFIFLFLLKLFLSKEEYQVNDFLKYFIFISIIFIFFIDIFTGFLANKHYNKEYLLRIEKIEIAKSNNDVAEIEYYSTIPSRMTYIQNPNHDKVYVKYYSKIYKTEVILKNNNNKLPFSRNTLKDFKYLFE